MYEIYDKFVASAHASTPHFLLHALVFIEVAQLHSLTTAGVALHLIVHLATAYEANKLRPRDIHHVVLR